MVIPDVAPSSTTGFWWTTGFVTGAARRGAGAGATGVRATGDALRLALEGALVEAFLVGRRVGPGLAFFDFGVDFCDLEDF
jgi:hypothetical protein